MTRGIAISASGLRLDQMRMEVSAFNTAGPVDSKYRLEVQSRENRTEGVGGEIWIRKRRVAGERIEETVERISAAQGFAAGVRIVQTQDEMLGLLVDIEG